MKNTKAKPKKKARKNPTDPIQLARSVVEAAIGEPLMPKTPPKKKPAKSARRGKKTNN